MSRYDWGELYRQLSACEQCGLSKTRNNVVIGTGSPQAEVMLVGEGPGRDEDLSGIPFVGVAGQLLDKMLGAIDLDREKVYIANIVKCRPPGNRTPVDDEAHACLPYLRAQVALVRPKIILCLGRTAARFIFDEEVRITRDRGVWRCKKGVWMLATYHPAALLRDMSKKADAWEDMKAVRDKLLELRGGK